MIKYLVQPGMVVSQSDGDRHYIDAKQLINLYEVSAAECVIDRGDAGGVSSSDASKLIKLMPKYDGNYNLKDL